MLATAKVDRSSAVQFIKWASAATLVLTLVQLLLGANPVILLLNLSAAAIAFVPIYLYGFKRTIGILYIGVWLAFSFSALLAKTVLVQPIDSNLSNPLLTFCICLAGSLMFSIAAVAAYCVKPLQKNALPTSLPPSTLSILAVIFSVIGAGAFLVILMTPSRSLAANIAVQLAPLFGYACVCEMASVIVRTKGRRIISAFGFLLIAFFAYTSLSGNSKTGLLEVGLAYVLCMLAFRIKIKWPIIVSGILALALLSEYVFPAIHIVRNERDRLTPLDVAALTVQTTGELISGDQQVLAAKDALVNRRLESDRLQLVYFGSQQIWLDRFTNQGFIDSIARVVDFNGPFLGPDFILSQTLSFLPRQFLPGKETTFSVTGGDRVAQAYGLAQRDQTSAPTVPLPIELFVAGGFLFGFAVGIPLIFLCIMEINFLAFEFEANPWAICILITYAMLFYASTYDVYIFICARQLPTDWLLISGFIFLASALDAALGIAGGGGKRGPVLAPGALR